MIPKEVFLSHSAKNRKDATLLAETLRNHGVPVWYSPSNIKSAQQWHDEIGKALRRCTWFLLLLTRASVSSKWVKMELAYAMNHRQYNAHILPIKAEKCNYEDLSWTLGSIQMVNFSNGSDKCFREILGTWGLGLDPSKKVNAARKRPPRRKPRL
jgi:TIR domain